MFTPQQRKFHREMKKIEKDRKYNAYKEHQAIYNNRSFATKEKTKINWGIVLFLSISILSILKAVAEQPNTIKRIPNSKPISKIINSNTKSILTGNVIKPQTDYKDELNEILNYTVTNLNNKTYKIDDKSLEYKNKLEENNGKVLNIINTINNSNNSNVQELADNNLFVANKLLEIYNYNLEILQTHNSKKISEYFYKISDLVVEINEHNSTYTDKLIRAIQNNGYQYTIQENGRIHYWKMH